jgi:hypothetical protein
MGQKRLAYKILMGETLGNDYFEDKEISENTRNTQMNLMETGCEDVWWVELAQDRVQ